MRTFSKTAAAKAADAVCILNAASGSNRAAGQQRTLEKLFADHGKRVRVVIARSGNAVVTSAKEAAASKTPLVIAAGGDGTVSAVACMLAGTELTLGVIPLGTLNHFAKDLKIPLDLDAAVANLFSGSTATVDVGDVGGQIFINNSSLGLYPGVVQLRDALQAKGYRKWTAFARAMLYVLRRLPHLSVHLSADTAGDTATTTPFVFIGNNEYELSVPHAGERRALDAGLLWVYLAPHAGRWKLIRIALASLFGRKRPAELKVISTRDIWIRARASRIRVANDGEVLNLSPPLHYRSVPGALRVIIPAGPPKSVG